MESSRPTDPWKSGDELEAVRLEQMRHLAEAAQLYAASPNVHLYRGAQGGTAIAVDEAPAAAQTVWTMEVYGKSPASTGSVTKWTYDVREVQKAGTGHDWEEKPDGLTGTAYNLIETNNAAGTGLMGNGVTLSSYVVPDTVMYLQPVPLGTYVRCWREPVPESDEVEYWFQYENGIDGECEE